MAIANLKRKPVCSVLKQVPVVPWTIQVAALMTQAAAIAFIDSNLIKLWLLEKNKIT